MESAVRLTKLAKCAGCGAKMGAGTLSRMLSGFETLTDPNLLVGFERSDDASVYRLDDERALVQTVDFFPPVVDDPFVFGQIAAANAFSDVYAMGGEPRLAMNLMCVPEDMPEHTVREILKGGYHKALEAGVIITGGHTIHGPEPLYGLSVTGFVHPKKFLKNCGAKPGDVLILTKKLGGGILLTGAKGDMVEKETLSALERQMCTLNKKSAQAMTPFSVHACTDVTGFSLMGHALEMAQGSDCSMVLQTTEIPRFQEAIELAEMGFVPAGAYRNRAFAGPYVQAEGVSRAVQDICYDPQTSGGLLIAVPEGEAEALMATLKASAPAAAIIGAVVTRKEKSLYLV